MRSADRVIRPFWKLEASLKCRSCRKGRYAPPVRMIKLTERYTVQIDVCERGTIDQRIGGPFLCGEDRFRLFCRYGG